MGIFKSDAGYNCSLDECCLISITGMLHIKEFDISGKRVMVRADLNVAVSDGRVVSDKRIRAALETIEYAVAQNAAVIVISHFDRPVEGRFSEQYSLSPVAECMREITGWKIPLRRDWIEGVEVQPGEVVLCENVRFLEGEKECSDTLSRQMASLCELLVMDAFGAAHRDQASLTGVVKHAPMACTGILFDREIRSLDEALVDPDRPVVAIVGGAKLADKLPVLIRFSKLVDTMIVGGGIANTFLQACGQEIGKSLYAPELVTTATKIMHRAKANQCSIQLPVDAVVAKSPEQPNTARQTLINDIEDDDMIFDIGKRTAASYCDVLKDAGTIIWSGPIGMFEIDAFSNGSKAVADAVVDSDAHSVAGGGDTLAILQQQGVLEQVSYASTGGGAFLEYIQGKSMPVIEALHRRTQ